VSAVRFRRAVVIAEHKHHRVIAIENGKTTVLAADLPAPTGLFATNDDLFVTDRQRGEVLRLARNGKALAAPEVVARGLTDPEGITWFAGGLAVVESSAGRVSLVSLDGVVTPIASVPPSSSTASEAQPPSFIFNGIAGGAPGNLYLASERDRSLIRIDLPKGFTPAK
jgi:glucose/arabinose dehydrogenase